MAQVVGNNQVKLNDGRVVAAQQGGWYDAQQYWGGSLSNPGVINSQSNQVGAGKPVSAEVNRQTSIAAGKAPNANQDYIDMLNARGDTAYGSDGGGGFGMDGGGGGLGLGSLTGGAPAINLPDIYKNLYAEAGLGDIEKGITDKTKKFNDAISTINDNPYMSEASRTGRLEKLRIDFNNDIKNDQDSLTMKKADIQMQLDLQTKQFDINSQTAKFALDTFNMLLSSGALAGASGADIASITKSTGISSSMIQSAIKAQTQKDRQTSVTTVDDGKNIYSVVIDSKTGQIINKQVLSTSKPTGGGSGSGTAYDRSSYYSNALRQDAAKGLKLSQVFSLYTGYLDPNDIYALYNANSKYGPDKGDIKNLAKYGVTQSGSSQSQNQQLLDLLSK